MLKEKRYKNVSESVLREIKMVLSKKYLSKNKQPVKNRRNNLNKKLSDHDNNVNVYYHEIELFTDLGEDESVELLRLSIQLKKCLKSRRKVKQLIEFYRIVREYYKTSGTDEDFNELVERTERWLVRIGELEYKGKLKKI